MKTRLFLSVVFLLLEVFNVSYGQIPSWPPGGITPGPMQFLLPSSRIIPSTKRYNLVWADQLFGLPANKISFVAQNYVGTQKIFSYQADDYRQINPNFLVISYHLANGLNPQQHDDCPDPKTNHGSGYIGVVAPNGFVSEWNDYFIPWLNTNSIIPGSNRYEQMFQHYDLVDSVHRVWHIDPFWTMNLENADWRDYMGDNIVSWMIGNQNEGAFLDVSVETMVSPLYNPNSNDPVPYNFNWYISPHSPAGYTINTLNDFSVWMNEQYLRYYQYLYQRFHTGIADYLVLPNTDQMVTSWYDPVWTDGDSLGETIDGAMMEGFGNYTGSDMYLTLDRGLRHLTVRGKILIAQFSDSSQSERYRRVGMYMLIKNENSYLCIRPGHVEWYPEYEIDLGDQSALPSDISGLRVSGSGSASLLRRDYSDGMVLCNTSSAPINYSLTGSWQKIVTSGGGEVDTLGLIASQSIQYIPVTGSVTVNASDCMILKNNTGTNINSSGNIDFEINVRTRENNIELNIKSDKAFEGKLFLKDISGKIIKNIYNGVIYNGSNFEIPTTGISHGVYFLVVEGNGRMVKRIVF